jgi:hypothetical protein
MRDLMNAIHLARALSPTAAVTDNTAFVSQIVDRRGHESLVFAILTGSLADADATFAVTMSHGDDPALGDAEAVPDDQILGSLAAAGFAFGDDDEVRKLGYRGPRRYVRLTVTPSGNSGAAYVAAIAILGHPATQPTANPPS